MTGVAEGERMALVRASLVVAGTILLSSCSVPLLRITNLEAELFDKQRKACKDIWGRNCMVELNRAFPKRLKLHSDTIAWVECLKKTDRPLPVVHWKADRVQDQFFKLKWHAAHEACHLLHFELCGCEWAMPPIKEAWADECAKLYVAGVRQYREFACPTALPEGVTLGREE